MINKSFLKLYKKFCPGPITFVLKLTKESKISKVVTNKKKTLAVRFPKHPVTRELLKRLNYPLAAPSANLSSKLSAVCPSDVRNDFGKKIKNKFLEGEKFSQGN
jgi:Putative translation factor (SUA5)